MKLLLVGNYGVGNLGDEALKEYFLTRFPEIEWTVLSASPENSHSVPRLPFGIRSLLTTPWWRTFKALKKADAVVFGGGSLFTDSESVKACFLWWWHTAVARLAGKPFLLAFQGIGPFRTMIGESLTKSAIKHARFISVRDEESAKRVGVWFPPFAKATGDKGDRVRVVVSFDPVVSLLPGSSDTSRSENILAIIPRANSGDVLRNAVRDVLAAKKPASVRILSVQPDDPVEQQVCASLTQQIGAGVAVHTIRSLGELTQQLSACSSVITERYHGALAALAMGIATQIIPQQDGDKLDRLRKETIDVSLLRERVTAAEDQLRKTLNML